MKQAQLFVYPAIELAGFMAALWSGHAGAPLWLTLALLGGTALAFSFALHISFHEWMHQGRSGGLPGEFMISALMGMPAEGYRWHHQNHHQHENALEDFSTTWRAGAQGPEPQGWLSYAVGWPRQLARSAASLRARDVAGTLPDGVKVRLRRQKRFLQVLFFAMLVVSWKVALAWFATLYAGWVLVSVHNYGQHPPVDYGSRVSTSYRGALYNAITCANGLHHEHHRDPALPWEQLTPADGAPLVTRPHLLLPRFRGPA